MATSPHAACQASASVTSRQTFPDRPAPAALAAELEEGSWSWDKQPEPLVAAAGMLRARLEDEGVALPDHFAVGVCHFEGWGAEESVPLANPDAVVDLLRRRRLDPSD